MRIEAYNQIQQMYKVNKVNKPQASAKATMSDRVQISSFGKDIQTAKAALASTPDIREEMTAPVKAQIQAFQNYFCLKQKADSLYRRVPECLQLPYN